MEIVLGEKCNGKVEYVDASSFYFGKCTVPMRLNFHANGLAGNNSETSRLLFYVRSCRQMCASNATPASHLLWYGMSEVASLTGCDANTCY